MPTVIWDFTIQFDGANNPVGPNTIGLKAPSAKDVEELAEVSGLELTANFESPRRGSVRQLRIMEKDDSPKLKAIIEEIARRYSLVPATRMPVPVEERDRSFGVSKRRTYTRKEIVNADLLCLYELKRPIAEHAEGTAEQAAREIYVVEPGSVKRRIPIGFLSPFGRIAVSNDMKSNLASSGLQCLAFETILNGDGIWKLSSSVTMPRCLLPLVGGDGHEVNESKFPHDRASWRYYEDGGCLPPELSFERDSVNALRAFDIAKTAEQVGDFPLRSNRLLVVSQRFRETLESMKLKGLGFVPVKLTGGGSEPIV